MANKNEHGLSLPSGAAGYHPRPRTQYKGEALAKTSMGAIAMKYLKKHGSQTYTNRQPEEDAALKPSKVADRA